MINLHNPQKRNPDFFEAFKPISEKVDRLLNPPKIDFNKLTASAFSPPENTDLNKVSPTLEANNTFEP